MAKIAFILLCHKNPEAIVQQARQLTAVGDYMSIHFDARASAKDFEQIKTALEGNPNVAFAKKRIKCGWGEWSLVRASLNAIEAAVEAFPRATHFYMVSGDCMSIKSAEYAHEYLDANDKDYIESFDFFESDWIKTGMKGDRLFYRHYINERSHKYWFYAFYEWQKRLGLKRKIPEDLQIMIGSQWWCLRRKTIERIIEFSNKRRDVIRFFASTWIPDETYFQTLVRHLVPEHEINGRTLTFLMFSDYGMPVHFYNDHYDMLLSQDFLFARKISEEAAELRARLGRLYAEKNVNFRISEEGRSLYKFLAGRGRIGRRYAMRFWEAESTLGRERELLIILCKKWHIAKRLVDKIRQTTSIPAVEYLFNEEGTPLPDLGGIQTSLSKRTRHRRALVRLLFDYFESNRMIVCIDPGNIELLHDFFDDRSKTALLEVDCEFDDDFLLGHALRIGLAGEMTPEDTLRRLLPTMRQDLEFEIDRIRDSGFTPYYQLRENSTIDLNTEQLQKFLATDAGKAKEIASIPQLFAD
ncbi:MAG: DUF5928 domain-containing protein [Paracoccaceae bacterium]|nr:DUF5928 domain-containing protein [Paracoccaceae bacterium]MDG1737832.1 DUF5928 domain-containing protein [Paracoccaceae bacterium]MDG2260081.1 DUF5928 domain-containing protein [Paracoccaceae bacterium]